MSTRQPLPEQPRETRRTGVDPAHAPGKQHISREVGSAKLHAIDRRLQNQRMPSSAPPVGRRNDRGR